MDRPMFSGWSTTCALLFASVAACSTPTPVVDSGPDSSADGAVMDRVSVDRVEMDHSSADVVAMDASDAQEDASSLPDASGPDDASAADVTAPEDGAVLCADPLRNCGGACVDVFTNNAHCGGCNVPCAMGQACTGGVCMVPCPTGQTRCAGTCVDTLSSGAHCGSCGFTCSASQVCRAGSCTLNCPAGETECSFACVNTQTNARNCGVCGRACAATETCVMGSCQPACPPGQTQCGGVCVDTNSSSAHCGRCGNTCGAGQFCSAGTCGARCDPPTTACGALCVNLMSADTNNCGACGRTCASAANASPICTTGTCGLSCNVGFANCDSNSSNGCEVNTAADSNNCGSCGNVCVAGANQSARCLAGGCTRSCNAGFADCDGDPANGCETDTRTSALNCGRCGNACPAAAGGTASCAAGSCARSCPAGRNECTTGGVLSCVDYQTDASNCGGCGNACPSGQSCVAGACRALCTMGQTACGASMTCVDLLSNNMNCGACGRACAAGATCTRGACLEPFRVGSLSSSSCVTSVGDFGLMTEAPVAGTSSLTGYNSWTMSRDNATWAGGPALEPHDTLVSDLLGNAWVLGDARGPITRGTGPRQIDRLLRLTYGKLRWSTTQLLTRSITIDTNGLSTQQAIYSGVGRIGVHTDELYEIDTRTGGVTVHRYMGMPIPQPSRASSPHFVTTGILESVGASRWLVYVQNSRTIARLNIANLAVSSVGNYNIGFGLGDAAHLALSPDGARWLFRFEGPSVLGNLNEGFASCPATTGIGGGDLLIGSLSTVGCELFNTVMFAGDDRGPIAHTGGDVMLTGADATILVPPFAFNTTRLERIGPYTGHIASNLADSSLWGLHVGETPAAIDNGHGWTWSVDRVVPISATTARAAGAPVMLSQPVLVDTSTPTLVASGWNRLVILSRSTAWNIELPSGRVTNFGVVVLPTFTRFNNVARGVVESQGATTSIVLVQNANTISRWVLGGAVTPIASFANLGNAWSVSVSASSMRWLSGSQSAWQFGAANTAASCPMTFTR